MGGSSHARRVAVPPPSSRSRDLQRVGLANQTTMLMSESVQVQEALRQAFVARFGQAGLAQRFRAFDTICSATQDRQDAVQKLLADPGLAVMVVIGGYNSSNTIALARLCGERLPTYHISGAECLDGAAIRFKPVGEKQEARADSWLPAGPLTLGLTAGASTPNNIIGAVVERLDQVCSADGPAGGPPAR